jgi:hypothetical protein
MKKVMISCVAAALMMFVLIGSAQADHGRYGGGYGGGYGGYAPRVSYHGGHGHHHHGHHHHGHHHHGHVHGGYRGGYYGGYQNSYRPSYGNSCRSGGSGISLYFGF